MILFVYVDWTTEETPRAFYAGKGNPRRIKKRERNSHWKNIAAKYAWRREVVLATKDESFAFEEEKRHIAELGTFEDGTFGRWGANKTEGGEGCSGYRHTLTTKEKMANLKRGKPLSPKHREKIGISNQGRLVSDKTRMRQSLGRRGIPVSEEQKRKISLALIGRKLPDEVRAKMTNRGGENNSCAKLTWEIVRSIRASTLKGYELARLYDVSLSTISGIRLNKTWKETVSI